MFSESRNDWRNLAAADRLRDRDNAAGIGDNSAGIGNNSAKICDKLRKNRRWRRRDRRYRRERDPMLNSILNGDWSNSVPGRQIPEGVPLSPYIHFINFNTYRFFLLKTNNEKMKISW